MARFSLEPTESQEHSHSFDVNVVVEVGSVEVTIHGVKKLLNQGECIFVERNASHKVHNLSEKHCLVNCERIQHIPRL